MLQGRKSREFHRDGVLSSYGCEIPPSLPGKGPWCCVALLKLFRRLSANLCLGDLPSPLSVHGLFFGCLFRGWGEFVLFKYYFSCAVSENLKQQGRMVTWRARK